MSANIKDVKYQEKAYTVIFCKFCNESEIGDHVIILFLKILITSLFNKVP